MGNFVCYQSADSSSQLDNVQSRIAKTIPDSKVHGANMGLIWVRWAPDGPHVGPMNLAIRNIGSTSTRHRSDIFALVSRRSDGLCYLGWSRAPCCLVSFYFKEQRPDSSLGTGRGGLVFESNCQRGRSGNYGCCGIFPSVDQLFSSNTRFHLCIIALHNITSEIYVLFEQWCCLVSTWYRVMFGLPRITIFFLTSGEVNRQWFSRVTKSRMESLPNRFTSDTK